MFLLSVIEYTFIPPYFERIVAENPEVFELAQSDSTLELVLELYRFSWCLIIVSLLIITASTLIQMHKVGEENHMKLRERHEREIWNEIFAKLIKICKAIRPKEAPSKQVAKKTVSRKPSSSSGWFKSFDMINL